MALKFRLMIWAIKLLYHRKYIFVDSSIILGQARLETGNFTSGVFLNAKNLFGMKKPRIRESYGIIGEYTNTEQSAIYVSHWASIRDYFMRMEALNVSGGSAFLESMQTGNYKFNPSEQYVARVKENAKYYTPKLGRKIFLGLVVLLPLGSIVILKMLGKNFKKSPTYKRVVSIWKKK